jgi:hypothetical protein
MGGKPFCFEMSALRWRRIGLRVIGMTLRAIPTKAAFRSFHPDRWILASCPPDHKAD